MRRNLFDLDNARYLNRQELVNTFIPTEAFKRIFAAQNQIIIGSRGSGKTALLKMVSHDHLALSSDANAKEIIDNKTFIGVHISTKTKFVGGLKNKDWTDDDSKERDFRWLMNIASCLAILDTIKSCLSTYINSTKSRTLKEIEIISKVSELWLSKDEVCHTIPELSEKLEDIVTEKSKATLLTKIYGKKNTEPIGLAFDMELFEPILSAINVVNRKLDFPEETSWFICIDEIEILDEFHHRILNSYMRANMGNVFFKFTTLPYCHYTLETNTNVPLDIRHDVHYVYIDQDNSFNYKATDFRNLSEELFNARAAYSKPDFSNYTLDQLFGDSQLLDSREINYDKISDFKNPILTDEQLNLVIQSEPILQLFEKYSNPKTRDKGRLLLKNKEIKRFGNEFGRKMRGLLILKDYVSRTTGNQRYEIYSGARTVINLGDCNPRKLLSIFQSMIRRHEASSRGKTKKFYDQYQDGPIISYADQNYVLASIAEREINRYKIERNFGQSLFDFVSAIGEYMHDQIHNKLINTEQISSIKFSGTQHENTWKIIERAVQKGLIYPNINIHNPDEMPYKEGVFHLAFIFSPKFKLLPRRGDAKNISNIIKSQQLIIQFDA